MATEKQEEDQRDQLNELKFTLDKVVMPALEDIRKDQQALLQKDFLTEARAARDFVPRSEVEQVFAKQDNRFVIIENNVHNLNEERKKRDKYWVAFATAVIGALVVIAFQVIQNNGGAK